MPPDDLYEACRVMARHVRHAGGLQWDTAALHEMEIDPEFVRLVESYLRDVLDAKAEHKGWKLPEPPVRLSAIGVAPRTRSISRAELTS